MYDAILRGGLVYDGSRAARMAWVTPAEGHGVMGLDSIEAVRDGMSQITSDERFFYPCDFPIRAAKVSQLMGFVDDVDISSFVDKDTGTASLPARR